MKGRRNREEFQTLSSVTLQEGKAFEEMAIERLKVKGYRITMPRVQVIRALAHTNQALSAYGIHESIVRNGGRIDVVSVYRILSTLAEVGLIHHIGVVDGFIASRILKEGQNKTQHLICKTSGIVQEVEVPEEAIRIIEKQLKELSFEASQIKIEILGNSSMSQLSNKALIEQNDPEFIETRQYVETA